MQLGTRSRSCPVAVVLRRRWHSEFSKSADQEELLPECDVQDHPRHAFEVPDRAGYGRSFGVLDATRQSSDEYTNVKLDQSNISLKRHGVVSSNVTTGGSAPSCGFRTRSGSSF